MKEMKTYLLLWNPRYYRELYDNHKNWKAGTWKGTAWATGKMKTIPMGSRLFIMRVGKEPKGIIASGWTVSAGYQTAKDGNVHEVELDLFVHPDEPRVLLKRLLEIEDTPRFWTPRCARSLPDDVAEELERVWRQGTN